MYKAFVFFIAIFSASGLAVAEHEIEKSKWSVPTVSFPSTNPYSENKALLGKKLFFDPRLSGYGSLSCASCHNPGLNWSDGLSNSQNSGHFALGRHTPSIINVAFYNYFFWDGRAATLEEQVKQHLLSPGVMHGGTAEDVTGRIYKLPDYRSDFALIFGEAGITLGNIAAAIATFERTVMSGNSSFDRWQTGDEDAVSASVKRGFTLFSGKAKCIKCHSGHTFTDSGFHNTGLNSIDPGRYEVTGRDEDRNSFKTPSLRHVALTPPYMHDGSKANLAIVIDFYNRGGDKPHESNELTPLKLTDRERDDIISFLKSLSGEFTEVTVPQLPQP